MFGCGSMHLFPSADLWRWPYTHIERYASWISHMFLNLIKFTVKMNWHPKTSLQTTRFYGWSSIDFWLSHNEKSTQSSTHSNCKIPQSFSRSNIINSDSPGTQDALSAMIIFKNISLVGHHWKERPTGQANFICPSTGERQGQKMGMGG